MLSIMNSDSFGFCPPFCDCTNWDIRTISCFKIEVLPSFHPSTTHLWLEETRLSSIPPDAFANMVNISHIYIFDDESLKLLDRHSFHNLPKASHIEIRSLRTLSHIDREAFKDLPHLKYLEISNTGLLSFPELGHIHSSQEELILDISDNPFITVLPANAFNGISESTITLMLNRNGLTEIQAFAFNESRLEEVNLKRNVDLVRMDEKAFAGVISGPVILDISESRVSILPSIGLEFVEKLLAENTWALKKLPPLEAFQHLQSAQLTYPSHCCGLQKMKRWRGHVELGICNLTNGGVQQISMRSAVAPSVEYQSLRSVSLDPHQINRSRPHATVSPYNEYNYDTYDCLTEECMKDIFVEFPTEHLDEGFDYTLCDDDKLDQGVICLPKPDAFNPCEDVMSLGFLRVSLWVVSSLAILANLLVLLILLSSHSKLTITRFLICNLAFADFCMGMYLLLIASVDWYTRSQYYHYAIAWQTSPGCHLAGALTVFASQLSVYTLTAITLQRWHVIIFAMSPQHRLRLRHALVVMLVGWVLCLLQAFLPLVGVSSYQRVSICLPMDIETHAARIYVVSGLVVNVLAFMVVCVCYVHIYCMVHNPQHQSSRGDASMAKRMAVLIFTNFLCLAPISFYGLSATLHRPLITVTDSKVLLVLIYPLNSCANPFLYAILTRAFHTDVFLLLSKMGICRSKAQLYREQLVIGRFQSSKPCAVKSK
ncbi:thyrotropin receptor-like [Hypomesus transpacificus]|uniref:thyrotropin receptor-like n=1 Tax=Hypomesus transpacificus TaxID=137520 RepID=UPI001F085BEC|nr:thyrotropin receptor-like [Hypomesus transpacificus]